MRHYERGDFTRRELALQKLDRTNILGTRQERGGSAINERAHGGGTRGNGSQRWWRRWPDTHQMIGGLVEQEYVWL